MIVISPLRDFFEGGTAGPVAALGHDEFPVNTLQEWEKTVAMIPAADATRLGRSANGKGGWMLGFLILVGFQLLGIGLHKLGVPLPGGVLGLLLFIFSLAVGLVKLKWVERTAGLLVRHMTLLFIPLMAGLPELSTELRRDGVTLLASMVISLLAVLLATGGLAHLLLRDDAAVNPHETQSEWES